MGGSIWPGFIAGLLLLSLASVVSSRCNFVELSAPRGQENARIITDNLAENICYNIRPASRDEYVYFNVIEFNLPPTERNPNPVSSSSRSLPVDKPCVKQECTKNVGKRNEIYAEKVEGKAEKQEKLVGKKVGKKPKAPKPKGKKPLVPKQGQKRAAKQAQKKHDPKRQKREADDSEDSESSKDAEETVTEESEDVEEAVPEDSEDPEDVVPEEDEDPKDPEVAQASDNDGSESKDGSDTKEKNAKASERSEAETGSIVVGEHRSRTVQYYICSKGYVYYSLRNSLGAEDNSEHFCGYTRPQDLGDRYRGDTLKFFTVVNPTLRPGHGYRFVLEYWSSRETLVRDPCYERSAGPPESFNWPPTLIAHDDIRSFAVPVGPVSQQDTPTVNVEKVCQWKIISAREFKNIRIQLSRDNDPERNNVTLLVDGQAPVSLEKSFSSYQDTKSSAISIRWSPFNPKDPPAGSGRWLNVHGSISTGFSLSYTTGRLACMAAYRPVTQVLEVTSDRGRVVHTETVIQCPDDYGQPRAQYGINQHCSWQILLKDPSKTACLAYEFENVFDIESGYKDVCLPYECEHDNITIQVAERRDNGPGGPQYGATYVQTFCGRIPPPAVTVDGASLLFTFRSNAIAGGSGFRVRVFTVTCRRERCQDSNSQWPMAYKDFCVDYPPHQKYLTGRDDHLASQSSPLGPCVHSPCYPDNYPPQSNCSYLIQSKPGHAVEVSFDDGYQIGSRITCNVNYFHLFGGSENTRYCGEGAAQSRIINEQQLNGLFISADQSDRGFSLELRKVAPKKHCPITPKKIFINSNSPVTLDSRTVFGSNVYPNNLDCAWDISFPKCESVQYSLTVTTAPCEPASCEHDIVYVNGRTYCYGASDVRGTISKRDSLKGIVRFVTDYQNTGGGFVIVFVGVNCQSTVYLKALPEWDCFQTPNWDEATGSRVPDYEPGTECKWVIEAAGDDEFEALQLKTPALRVVGGDYSCRQDFVQLTVPGQPVRRYCSESDAFPKPYTTGQRRVVVDFKANDDKYVDKGLEMCYRIVLEQCPVVRRQTGCQDIEISRGPGFGSRWFTDHAKQDRYCTWVISTTQSKANGFAYEILKLDLNPKACVSLYAIFTALPADNSQLPAFMNSPIVRVCGTDSRDKFKGSIDAKVVIVKFEHTDLNTDFKMIFSPNCLSCTQPFALLATKLEQTLNGPSYSPGIPQPYASGLSCEWIITVPQGYKHLLLRFTRMDVPSLSSACEQDSVSVYRPASSNRPFITLCSRADWRNDIILPGVPDVRIAFESNNDVINGDGFQLIYNLVAYACEPYSTISLSECGGSTTIQPPLDPIYQTYYSCQECYWTIVGDDCTSFEFNMKRLDLEPSACEDYVAIYAIDGPPTPQTIAQVGNDRFQPVHKFCGSNVGSVTVDINKGDQKIMVVRFHTSDHLVKTGFLLEVVSSGACCSCPGLRNVEATKDIKQLESPNYPFQYFENQECRYTIIIPAGYLFLELRFEKIDVIGGNAACTEDSVTVGNNRYCRENRPPRVIRVPGSERSVDVVFISDGAKVDGGFRLAYYLAPYRCPVRTIENSRSNLTIDSRQVMDPNSPFPGTYYSCVDCLWLIKTECLGFTMRAVRLDLDPSCQDYVSIYVLNTFTEVSSVDQVVNNFILYKKLCVNDLSSFVIRERYIAIIFHSDYSLNFRGFELELAPFSECPTTYRESDHTFDQSVNNRLDPSIRTLTVVHNADDCLAGGGCDIIINPEKPCTLPNQVDSGYVRIDFWYENDATRFNRCQNKIRLFVRNPNSGFNEWDEVFWVGPCSGYEQVLISTLQGDYMGPIVKFSYDVYSVINNNPLCNISISYTIICRGKGDDLPCQQALECPREFQPIGVPGIRAPSNQEMRNCPDLTHVYMINNNQPDSTTFELRFVTAFEVEIGPTLPSGCQNALNDYVSLNSVTRTEFYCGSWSTGNANVVKDQIIVFSGRQLNVTSRTVELSRWFGEAFSLQFRCPDSQCAVSRDCNYGFGRDPYTCCVAGKCVCTEGRVLVNGRCQLVSIGGPCERTSECTFRFPGSECVSGRCLCGQGYFTVTQVWEPYCQKVEVGTVCDPKFIPDICGAAVPGLFCDPDCYLCKCPENHGLVDGQCRPLSTDSACHLCYVTGGECVDLIQGPFCSCPENKFSSVGNALLTGCDRGISTWGQPCNENCTCANPLRCTFSPPDRKCCACPPGTVAVPAPHDPLCDATCRPVVTKPPRCEKCLERGGTCYGCEKYKTVDDCHCGCVCPRHRSTSDLNNPDTDCDIEHVLVDCLQDRMVVCYNATGHWFHPTLKEELLSGNAIAYVRYHLQVPGCRFTLKEGTRDTWCHTVHYDNLICGVKESHPGSFADEYRLRGIVQRSGGKSRKYITKDDFEFHAFCRYDNIKNVNTGGLVTDIRPKGVVGQRIRANLDFRVHSVIGLDVSYSWVFIGDLVKLTISLIDNLDTYKAIRVMNCFALDRPDIYASKHACLILENGCPVEHLTHQTMFRSHEENPTVSSTGLFPVFTVGLEHEVYFCCSVRVCLHEDDCKPAICPKNRKRRSAQAQAHTENAVKNAMTEDPATLLDSQDDDVLLVNRKLRVLTSPRPSPDDETSVDEKRGRQIPSPVQHQHTNSGERQPGHGYRERDQLLELETLDRDARLLKTERERLTRNQATHADDGLPLNELLIAGVCIIALCVFAVGIMFVVKKRRDRIEQKRLMDSSSQS